MRRARLHLKVMGEPRSILITGASSGIGAALAQEYAGPGVTLYLGGRDAGRLDSVAKACARKGAWARPAAVEVTDAQGCARWIGECDAETPLDLVIANAGIAASTSGGADIYDESPEITRRIFSVNVTGTINTVLPAVARMRPRRRGQIAIVSSIAAFVPAPDAPAYAASKAAQRFWGEALRPDLAADGIGVSVICPGFIRTPMTAAIDFPMPFVMDADRAARIIRRGLAANRARIAFPRRLYLFALLAAILPPALTSKVRRRRRG